MTDANKITLRTKFIIFIYVPYTILTCHFYPGRILFGLAVEKLNKSGMLPLCTGSIPKNKIN
jgi:hypothetical protein